MSPADAISLYQREKAAYLARTADEHAAMLERVRVKLEADAGMKPLKVGRPRKQPAQEKKPVAAKEPKSAPTTFRCGHPRTTDNSYFHKSPGRSGYHECKTCAKERNAKRDRRPVGLKADRTKYHADYYQKNREKRIAQVIESQRRRQSEKARNASRRKAPRLYASGSDIKMSDDISRP